MGVDVFLKVGEGVGEGHGYFVEQEPIPKPQTSNKIENQRGKVIPRKNVWFVETIGAELKNFCINCDELWRIWTDKVIIWYMAPPSVTPEPHIEQTDEIFLLYIKYIALAYQVFLIILFNC